MESDNLFVKQFLVSGRGRLNELQEWMTVLESAPADGRALDTLFRLMHTFKGEAAVLGLAGLRRIAHEMEGVLACVRLVPARSGRACIDLLWRGLALLGREFDGLGGGAEKKTGADGVQAEIEDFAGQCRKFYEQESAQGVQEKQGSLRDRVGRLQRLLEESRQPPGQKCSGHLLEAVMTLRETCSDIVGARTVLPFFDQMIADIETMADDEGGVDSFLLGRLQEALVQAARGIPGLGAAQEKIIAAQPAGPEQSAAAFHVLEEQFDGIVRSVGLLDTVMEAFRHIRERIPAQDSSSLLVEFDDALLNLELLSKVILRLLLKARVTSPRMLFEKVEKLVLSLACAGAKKVRVETRGQDIWIEKTKMELLETILVHVVRNAVDHAIESVSERTAAGKPPEGKILVDCTAEGPELMLRVQDDGRGIDFAAVRLEAFRRSFISFEDLNTMDESRSAELIFLPGVTTRRSVSEVSGRGMGMNAVLHAVRAAGGSIGVRSQIGQGTVFTIRLPLGNVTLPPGPDIVDFEKKAEAG